MTAPAETVRTLRYRAAMDLAYAVALLHLFEHARQSDDEFEYGPLDLAAVRDQGLTVSGPRLEQVQKLLAEIPGLYLSDELGGAAWSSGYRTEAYW